MKTDAAHKSKPLINEHIAVFRELTHRPWAVRQNAFPTALVARDALSWFSEARNSDTALRRSLWQTDTVDKIFKTQIRSNSIENWIRIEVDHQIVTLLKSLLQPFKNAIFVPHSHARC